MRILLTQVPTSHLGAGERVYPLGLSRLAGIISGSAETMGLDMNLSPDPWPDLMDTVQQVNPHMVALSFRNLDPLAGHHASYLSSLKTAARVVRHLAPRARIFAGGPAFSLFARRLMQEIPEIDGGIIGEGEKLRAKYSCGDFVHSGVSSQPASSTCSSIRCSQDGSHAEPASM